MEFWSRVLPDRLPESLRGAESVDYGTKGSVGTAIVVNSLLRLMFWVHQCVAEFQLVVNDIGAGPHRA